MYFCFWCFKQFSGHNGFFSVFCFNGKMLCPSQCEFAEVSITRCLSSRHVRLWLIQRPDQKTFIQDDIIRRWERLNFSLIWEIRCDVRDADPKDLISSLFSPSLNRCACYQICSLLLVPDFLLYRENHWPWSITMTTWRDNSAGVIWRRKKTPIIPNYFPSDVDIFT